MAQRGRPATGQNTKVIRVPKDFDRETAMQMYYEWLEVITQYRLLAESKSSSPRAELLRKLMEELGEQRSDSKKGDIQA